MPLFEKVQRFEQPVFPSHFSTSLAPFPNTVNTTLAYISNRTEQVLEAYILSKIKQAQFEATFQVKENRTETSESQKGLFKKKCPLSL